MWFSIYILDLGREHIIWHFNQIYIFHTFHFFNCQRFTNLFHYVEAYKILTVGFWANNCRCSSFVTNIPPLDVI